MRSNRYSLGTKKFEGHSGFHHLIYRKIQTFPDSFWHRPSSLESMLFLTLSYAFTTIFLWRSKNNLGSLSTKSFAQSICTHYSSLSGWSDIFLGSGTLKNRSKIWIAKGRVQKNRVIGIQKRRSSLASSLFE